MFKLVLASLALCFASVSFAAIPSTMNTCEPSASLKVAYKIVDKSLSIDLSGKGEDGKPFQGSSTYTIINSADFTAAEFSADDIKVINTIAGISSFTNGVWLDITTGNEKSSMMYLEFSPGQYSVLWVVQGFPLPLGKTDLCN